jgi:uncharacterized protein YwqG
MEDSLSFAAREAFARLPRRVQAAVKPCVRLKTTRVEDRALRLGQSRIGGEPDLPADFPWPRYEGLALSFIAQLDLADFVVFADVLPLPSSGSLFFFYDSDQRAGGYDPKHRGSALVAYIPDSVPLVRTRVPDDVAQLGRFSLGAVHASLDRTIGEFDPPLSPEELEALNQFIIADLTVSSAPSHQLGGNPEAIQGPMEAECSLASNGIYCGSAFLPGAEEVIRELERRASEWRLLLQVDTDDDLGMMWGDCGRLYYWIREEDLLQRAFERAWLILQCS